MAAASPNCGSSGSGSSSAGDGPIRTKAQALVDDPMRSDDPEIWTASPFRVALPQVLATLAQSLLLLALGMMVAVPTVVIAALRTPDHPDQPDHPLHSSGLHLDDTQASWFVGILLGCQPLGSLLSGWLSEALGRKRCMMAVSAPQLAGWLLLSWSDDLLHLYLSALLMGFSIGFMEAPGLSYVGEITQPHLRANMCSLNSLNVPLGYLVMYLLGSLLTWRQAAMASAALPLITLAALSMVPESPLWLLRRGRDSEAEASLCWLRGWVTPEEVRAELAATRAYSDRSRITQTRQTTSTATGQLQLYIEVPANGNGPRLAHRDVVSPKPGGGPTLCEKIKDLARPAMMRPLRLVVVYFFFYHCAGLTGVRPYMIQVFTELQFPLNPYWITVASAALQIAGGVLCMLTIHRAGKRLISMVSISACSLCLLLLAVYSFGRFRQPSVPMALFGALFFFTNLGIAPVPWALISEVFPPRGRGVGGGLSSALYYMMYFAVSKTFLDVRTLAGGLGGVFLLYGALGVLGLLFVYFCLPETEGKDLADIERFFSGGRDHDDTTRRRRQPINA